MFTTLDWFVDLELRCSPEGLYQIARDGVPLVMAFRREVMIAAWQRITSVVAVKGGKEMMFFVHPKSHRDYTNALEILHSYKVKYQDNVRLNKHYITVSAEDGCPETTLCEMAFQMNFRQAGKVCVTCKGKGKSICGHLTFTSYIY